MPKIEINDLSEERHEENKKLIIRALTDKRFRKQLETNPKKALNVTGGGRTGSMDYFLREADIILTSVRRMEFNILRLSDELLCAGGGGYGIAGRLK
jgi:hypothetical protein